MSYKEDAGDVEGDFGDQLDYAWQGGYREGVDRVLEYLEPLDAYPEALLIELRWAIEDGMI